jgi:hypothetical protein
MGRSLSEWIAKQFKEYDFLLTYGARGVAVVDALRYKPEGRGIYSRRCHWNFSLT